MAGYRAAGADGFGIGSALYKPGLDSAAEWQAQCARLRGRLRGYDSDMTPANMTSATPSSSAISFGLGGRVCIVTGGAQGIGEACARRFAREGAKAVIADIDDARGQALAKELDALYVHCDVGDKAQVDAAGGRGAAGARPHRRAGEQRRHLQGRRFPGRHRSRLRRRAARQPQGLVPRGPGRGARDGQGRRGGAHRQHEFGQRRAGDPDHRQLQREQGRHQPAHAGDGAGAGRQGHPRQRGGAGHDRHRTGGQGGAHQRGSHRRAS